MLKYKILENKQFNNRQQGCDRLVENGPHRPIGGGTMRKCCLIGRRMSLGVGFKVSDAQARPNVTLSLLFPASTDTELLANSPALCLPVCHHASWTDKNGLNPNCKPTSVKCFPV